MTAALGAKRRRRRVHPDQLPFSAIFGEQQRASRLRKRGLGALAGCVLVDGYGRLLLLHRYAGGPAQWELPGGKVEPQETPEDAAAREIEEELGIAVKGLTQVGDVRFRQGGHGWRYFWYLPELVDGTPTLREPDRFDRLAFHRPVDLTQMMSELSPNVALLVCAYFDGRLLLPYSRSWQLTA